jgi:hypothetical protein
LHRPSRPCAVWCCLPSSALLAHLIWLPPSLPLSPPPPPPLSAEREGLQGGDPEGLQAVRRRRDWQDLVPQPEARGEGAGREHDGRGAGGDD